MLKIIINIVIFIGLISCGGGGSSGSNQVSPTVSNSIPTSNSSDQSIAGSTTVDFDAEKLLIEQSTEYKNQYGLSLIKTSSAYARGASGKGALVGVMDTGVDYFHQELDGINKFKKIYTTYDEDSPPSIDEKRHGTHVTAIISGEKDNKGMHGVAFDAEILFIEIKLGTASENYEPAEIDPSIDYTGYDNFQSYYESIFIRDGVDVVNGSFGFQGNITDYSEENIRYAFPKTIEVMAQQNVANVDKTIFVWSAGNAGAYADQGVDYSNPEVFAGMAFMIDELQGHTIAVVSVDESGEISSFSSRCGVSKDYCMAAPGRSINSAYSEDPPINNEYRLFSGTSMAAPHVTGGIALLVDFFKDQIGGSEIVDRLFKTANKSGMYSDSSIYGQGLLDLDAATRPVGQMMIATSLSLSRDLIPKSTSFISYTGLIGNSLLEASVGKSIVIFDELGAPFYMPLNSIIINKRPSIKWLSSYYSDPLRAIRSYKYNVSEYMQLSLSYRDKLNPEQNLGPILWAKNLRNFDSFSLFHKSDYSTFLFAGYGKEPSEYFSHALNKNNSDFEVFSSPYLLFASRGSFLGGGYGLTNSSSLSAVLFNGNSKLDEHFFEGPETSGYMLEFKKEFLKYNFSIVLGSIKEKSGLLGNSFLGAFSSKNPAYTRFQGLTASRFISGFKIMSSFYLGSTDNNFNDLSLIKSNENIDSNALSFGIYKDDAFLPNDSFGLYFFQPLSIYKGSMILNVPSARTKYGEVIFEELEFNLASKKRQRTLKLSYQVEKETYLFKSKLNLGKDYQAINRRSSQEGFFEIAFIRKLN
tara:strand:- start:3080 stop:5506 length:2427 start_codon:yes stop_codon:yes gene_type:complete